MANGQQQANKQADQAKQRAYNLTSLQSRIMFWCYLALMVMFVVARFDMDFIFVNIWTAVGAFFGQDWAVGTKARISMFIWAITVVACLWGIFLTRQRELKG